MNCPKCGKELLNVNGKYVCVDCGIEVPESGMAEPQVAEQSTPTAPTGNEQAKQTEEGPETTGQLAEGASPTEPQPTEPIISTEKAPDQAADASLANPGLTEPIIDSSIPIADLQAGEKEEPNQEKPLAEQPEPETPTQSEETAVPASKDESKPAVEPVPISIKVEPASETIQPEQQESEPVQEETPQSQEIDTPEIKSEPEPPDPFEAAEQPSPTSSQPEAVPVDAIQETTPAPDQAPPVQTDPTIFQDPMYDMNDTAARQPLDQSAPAPAAPPQDSTKKLKIILIAGIAVAVILTIGGIIAYFLLT